MEPLPADPLPTMHYTSGGGGRGRGARQTREIHEKDDVRNGETSIHPLSQPFQRMHISNDESNTHHLEVCSN